MCTIIPLCTVFLVFALFYYLLQDSSKNLRKLPPGPKGLPILGHLHMIGKNTMHKDLYKLAKTYGPIMYMKLGFVPTIIVSSPQAVSKFLKEYDVIFASRPHHEASWYLAYEQRNLTFAKYGPYWRDMRKLCTLELLSNVKIKSFMSMRREEVERLVETIRKEGCDDRDMVDVSASVSTLIANMSCLMVFGKKYMDKDFHDRGFKDVIKETLHLAACPNLGDFFPCLGALDIQGLNRRLKALAKVFDGFLEKIIDEHVVGYKEENKNKDFVDTMMSIMHSGEAGFEFDTRHVKAVLLDMLIASMDTSTIAIEWTMSDLLRHPQTMKKLQKELQDKVGMDRRVEESDLNGLQYLNMVIKESLRLHPVAPLLVREANEDCLVDGFFIKKNSRIVLNIWAIGHSLDVWPDPESFVPERFVEDDVDVRGHDFRLVPFGSGRRSCPGIQLGITVVKLVVAQLVHCFDWEVKGELDMNEAFGLLTGRAKHLMAIPTYRLNN